MRSRFLCAAITVLAASAVQAQTPVNCDCCAKKPRIDDPVYSTFAGQVAIATQADSGGMIPFGDRVVMIWDLTHQNAAPLGTLWSAISFPPTHPYSHSAWTVVNLGNVFGLTLDAGGNIYVGASVILGGHNGGSLSTGAGSAKLGQIYKLQNGSGTPVPFALLPQGAMGEGLGNLAYDCQHGSLYASDFYDGLIYRITLAGAVQPNPWDHGLNLPSAVGPNGVVLGRGQILGFDGPSSFAALGRRVWAVRTYKGRLYYSTWNGDLSGTHPGGFANEIWSVALDANGDPYPPARQEIILPGFSSPNSQSNPVSDISFSPLGTMLVAERTVTGNNSSYAHSSRVFEYSWNGTQWVLPNPTAYLIGVIVPLANSAGGVDRDFGPGGLVWTTGDAIHYLFGDYIYGLQAFPAGGGTQANSVLIDLNDDPANSNKTQIGDVRIPCPDCVTPVVAPVITGPQSKCVSPAHYSVVPQPGVTYTWTVTGGTPATGSGTSINVTWNGSTAGTVTVTASGPPGCGFVTSTLSVAPCRINCPFCDQFKFQLSVPTPVAGAGGLETVTPTVASTMPGITSVTVTLLNASVAYSPAFCGTSGPLPAYISQALPSSVASLNPPFLPVPNGNQAVWSGGSLAGGATTPFQLQLPPPPGASKCHATFSFCLRVSLENADCRSCDVIRCFGPFPYVAGGGGTLGNATQLVLYAVPGVLTFAVPAGSYLAQLAEFLQNQSDTTLPRRFVMDLVSFEPGKAALTEDSLASLNDLAVVLKAYPTVEVRLESFADRPGDPASARRLALERAQAVKAVLERKGVLPGRIAAEGLGAAETHETEGGQAGSGRIDLVVLHK